MESGVEKHAAYNADIVAWANEQAQLLRAGRLSEVDIEHIAEEIEDVGKSEQRELANRMAVLLMHLLKWQFQPHHRSNSWTSMLKEQRKSIERRLGKTPSLKNSLSEEDWLEDVWLDARNSASKETGLEFDTFPLKCEWTASQILDVNFFPDFSAANDGDGDGSGGDMAGGLPPKQQSGYQP